MIILRFRRSLSATHRCEGSLTSPIVSANPTHLTSIDASRYQPLRDAPRLPCSSEPEQRVTDSAGKAAPNSSRNPLRMCHNSPGHFAICPGQIWRRCTVVKLSSLSSLEDGAAHFLAMLPRRADNSRYICGLNTSADHTHESRQLYSIH